MIDVFIRGEAEIVNRLTAFGQGAQNRFRFVGEPAEGAVPLWVTGQLTNAVYRVDRTQGVIVSTADSDRIAIYLGMCREAYLLIGSVLGLTQWRALALNPLLQTEDFLHAEPCTCAFAKQPSFGGYALALENRYICPACCDFFRCVGTELEILTVQRLLASFAPAA